MKFVSIIIGIFFFVGSLSADKYVRIDGLKNICLRLEVRDINLALYKDETLSDLPNVYTEVALRYPDGKCGSFEMTFHEDIILLDRFLDELLPLIQSKNPIDKKEREALRCL